MAKICMVAYNYYELDNRLRQESEALVAAGYVMEVIALRDDAQLPKETMNGVKIYRVPMSKQRRGKLIYIFNYLAFLLITFCYVTALHLRNRYNLIHVHNMPDFLVFSALVPKMMGVPIILDIRDPMPELFGSIFAGKANFSFHRLLLFEEKISFRFADQLITVHQAMFDLLTKRGVDPSRLEIILNVPDPAIFGKPRVACVKSFFTLAYAGTLSPRYGLDLAVQALACLKGEMPDLRLRIIGDGPDLPRLENLSKEYQIEEKVDFVGAVPLDKVPELLGHCDVALATYSDDDFGNLVFPTKVAEALMLGLPVLCTRVATVLRYLDDSVLFYFNPGEVHSLVEQIRLIRERPELVNSKLKNGQKFLSRFNWDNEKVKLIQIIKNLCEKE